MIRIKRVYERPQETDGVRVLVDRLWPRGLSKDKARVDLWLKEIAPSDALRRWFAHDPKKWTAFRRKHRAELWKTPDALRRLRRIEREQGAVTLLYAASDAAHNNARVLAELLKSND